MLEIIRGWLETTRIKGNYQTLLSYLIATIAIFFIAYIVDLICRKIVLKIIHKMVIKTANKWDEIIYDKKVFHRLSHIPALIVIHIFSSLLDEYQYILQKVSTALIIILSLRAILRLLDAVVQIYNSFEFSKDRPIKGIIGVVKIFFYSLAGILLFGNFTTEANLLAMLSALGGMTAIFILIFSDTILGLVASIQLTASESLKIGDWIEMPSQNANGEVIDISLNKIKVQNWDRTISNIPAQTFLKEAFINWEGMTKSGGRRIMRSIFIDTTTIKILDEDLIKRLEKIEYIKGYLEKKNREVQEYNKVNNISCESIVNGRKLTNIGTFRAYIKEYLKKHPKISQNFILMVRQLAPTDKGLPLEIFAFTNDTAWENYEEIQSDIFDHLLAVVAEFDLGIFQTPSGRDLKKLVNENNEALK
ncbi:miniconductance mechanosensitive channel [Natranaerovirga pectinivora]|uniref:Miniconductance mechanosensitive channel n=1 Tax=Natranaerovirga pectinivora TaxID=682400 RepID=A0A4R3MPQ5_9FIRM|nr:mechanosensitive ion channel domain-containing protein [Natranaerovirga pectinivora]TCT16822.1 miniconductance mechanosensitive channel [Natranaerovirga pectinivora]